MSHTAEGGVMARKAYSYTRFSGIRQKAGDSQRRQDERAQKAAQEEGLPLDDTLRFHDKGKSGSRATNRKRGDLATFLKYVEDGTISPGSVLIIEQPSRLGRLPWLEQAEVWRTLLYAGVIVRVCEPAMRLSKANVGELHN